MLWLGNASDISTDELLVELKCASAIVKGDVIPIIGSKHKCEVSAAGPMLQCVFTATAGCTDVLCG